MAIEMCPSCGQLRNMRVRVSTRTETDEDGTERPIRTRSYHCETCGLFVRSEELDEGIAQDDCAG